MWPKIAAASALLLIQGGVVAQDCSYTVSVLDVPGVRCVSSAPCSGTYYASGLSQGVGACPSGSSCALLPQTPIMGCAAEGRTDLIYVNADGTLTKDGRSVTLQDSTTTTTSTPTTGPSTTSSNTGSKSTTGSNNGSKSTTGSSNGSKSTTGSSSTAHGSNSNASSGSSSNAHADGGSDASTDSSNSTISDSASASNSSSSSSSSSNSSSSDSMSDSMSGSVVSPGSSSANQQSFNPGSILSDGSSTINKAAGSGLSLGAVIGIVVGCLAVVAIAAGARLLQKGKEAEGELTTPEGAAMEGYNGGGGGSGMTPKENVLLL
ncbi:hypothetical protein PF005_g12767 [Phytophthora fragariae]|uniref:Carbohydrate-binding module family 19 domain-containing protein n=1 Tax=Phytophthora fragariae TaxID=53985 RepID=A0A6A3XTD2_9STRA|nr:hypothetical protein PF003_g21867 [Phytophthora fragariae]KAE8936040.1 hypothetical protein PF009_g14026 [Phytophthora fragariae]KAE9006239.1 hypothetical protein PF011_g11671 [Phytophthora fragariae]KAE9107729.1 hypothetical protein PF010_g12170 [Phytophthora fragariae]KAE9107910.1 hypothetical protein PF007_g12864 [Phytophthora fragariae]